MSDTKPDDPGRPDPQVPDEEGQGLGQGQGAAAEGADETENASGVWALGLLVFVYLFIMDGIQGDSWLRTIIEFGVFFLLISTVIAAFSDEIHSDEEDVMAAKRQFRLGLVSFGLVVAWWVWVGAHSGWLDFLFGYVGAFVLAFGVAHASTLLPGDVQDRVPLKAMLDRFLKDDRDGAEATAAVTSRSSLPLLLVAALGAWIGLWVADAFSHQRSDTDPGRFAAMPATRSVGLALSGGGYRAALFHSGVLDALERQGSRATHLNTVSGGSIVGAFYAIGGSACSFTDAVKDGRFNLVRDLVNLPNAMRLALPVTVPGLGMEAIPWWRFSRLDVQANLLEDILYGDAAIGDVASTGRGVGSPHLMISASDLTYGLQLGFSSGGTLVAGPTAARWLSALDLPESLERGRLARLVAVSGAFPGAFPATSTELLAPAIDELGPLSLADGGVIENSGITMLRLAHRLSASGAGWTEADSTATVGQFRDLPVYTQVMSRLGRSGSPAPAADWRLDVLVASDGGELLTEQAATRTLDAIGRALLVQGLYGGRPVANQLPGDPPFVRLAPAALLAPDGTVRPIGDALLSAAVGAVGSDAVEKDDLLDGLSTCDEAAGWPTVDLTATSPETLDLVRGILTEDILHAMEVFERSSTLSDDYDDDESEALFRLGRYSVLQATGLVP